MRFEKKWLLSGLIGSVTVASALMSGPVQAAVVAPGFDLLETAVGTSFDFDAHPDFAMFNLGVQAFTGNVGRIGAGVCPYAQFDFGMGCQGGLGTTSAIIQRLEQADSPSETIDIQLVALSLQSVNPIDIGAGAEILLANLVKDVTNDTFVTGNDDGSDMTIDFNMAGDGGTFTSVLRFDFVVTGSVSGISVAVNDVVFGQGAVDWGRTPLSTMPLLPGKNFELAGAGDPSADFFPITGTKDDPCIVPTPHLAMGHGHYTCGAVSAPSVSGMMASGAVGLAAVYGVARRRRTPEGLR